MIPNKKRLQELKAEVETEQVPVQQTAIEKFLNARIGLKNLEKKASDLEMEAINEALSILQSGNNKNNIVYQDSIAKIVITFRQKYLTSKELPELKRLEEEIVLERGMNGKRNAEELKIIEEELNILNEKILLLEQKQETLFNSKRTRNLLARHQECIRKHAYKIPGLTVYFK